MAGATLTEQDVKRICGILEGEYDAKKQVCTVKIGSGVLYITLSGVKLDLPDK